MRPESLVCGALGATLALLAAASPALADPPAPPGATATPSAPPLPPASPAPPPAPLVPARPSRIPLSVTVGGGVSLGTYQAGFLYYMAEAAKTNTSALELKLVSGASAGTVNALLTVLSSYNRPQDDPENNTFWNIWHGVGFDRLFVPSRDLGATAALSNRAFIEVAEGLRTIWNQGISHKTDVVLAVTVTRVAETRAVLRGSLAAPRFDDKIVLRLRGRGRDVPPELHNYVDVDSGAPQTLLDLPRDQSTPAGRTATFERLKELLLASAAFPVAFPSVKMSLCVVGPHEKAPSGGATECGDRAAQVELIDGGVYDNTPLRVAYRVARRLEAKDGEWSWNDAAAPAREPPAETVFSLVDKDNAGYPDAPDDYEENTVPGHASLLGYLGNLAGGFVATTMAKELAALYEEAPAFAPRVLSSVRHFPTASGHLANFFGFFEHELRRFDFYLGMYDASRMAADPLDKLMRTNRAGALSTSLAEPPAARTAAFRCMAAAYADTDVAMDACRAPGLETFRILLQVSLDRIYSGCDRLKRDPVAQRTAHPICQKAMHLGATEERRLVPGVPRARLAKWRAQPGESSLTHMMRLLAFYEFPFKDLGLDGAHAGEAMSRVRDRIGSVVEELASRQGFGERVLVSVAGKAALNFLHYTPPFAILYGAGGRGYELGASLLAARFTDSTSLRWSLAVEGKGVASLFDAAAGRERAVLSWGAVTGPDLELYGNAIAQVRLAGRGGFQISTRGWGTQAEFAQSSAAGSVPLVQVVPSLVLFERLRLQVAWEKFFPTKQVPQPGWELLYGLGFQFLSPFR